MQGDIGHDRYDCAGYGFTIDGHFNAFTIVMVGQFGKWASAIEGADILNDLLGRTCSPTPDLEIDLPTGEDMEDACFIEFIKNGWVGRNAINHAGP